MKWLSWYFRSNLLVRILVGLVLGSVAGLIFGPKISWVSPFGDVFVRLLKMIVVPVVLFTLVVGAASIHPARLGRVGAKALILYMTTTAFAVTIGLVRKRGRIFHLDNSMQAASLSCVWSGVRLDCLLPGAVCFCQMRAVFHRPHPQVEGSRGTGVPEFQGTFSVPAARSFRLPSP
jgi:hypothetical protein